MGKKKRAKRTNDHRIMVTCVQQDLDNIDKLVAMRKYGRDRSAVICAAVIHLLEKEGKQ